MNDGDRYSSQSEHPWGHVEGRWQPDQALREIEVLQKFEFHVEKIETEQVWQIMPLSIAVKTQAVNHKHLF